MTPQEALQAARHVLQKAVDGVEPPLGAEEAKALRAEAWDLRAELGRVKAQLERQKEMRLKMHVAHMQALEQEVAKTVSEEARAVAAEQRAAAAERDVDVLLDRLSERAHAAAGSFEAGSFEDEAPTVSILVPRSARRAG